MALTSEGNYTAEFLLSEANGERSRETVTIVSGQNLKAGAVLGKVTASGKYAAYDSTKSDGTQTAIAVLYADVDASSADADGVIIARDAEVASDLLVWATGTDKAGGATDLLTPGIIVRS